ncbi:MAG TPA: metalloregulator ArsR/SmtB family transcription factor [Candidatus Limnocylindrales bacterium]
MTVETSNPAAVPGSPALTEVFRALSDPTRLAIYELVRTVSPEEGQTARELENSVSQIAKGFDLSLSTVSHHLKELRRAGLITCERRGQFVYCRTDTRILAELEAFIRR